MSPGFAQKARREGPPTFRGTLIAPVGVSSERPSLLDRLARQSRLLCRAANAARVMFVVCEGEEIQARIVVDRELKHPGGVLGPWLPPLPDGPRWVSAEELRALHEGHPLLGCLSENELLGIWSLGALRTGEPIALYVVVGQSESQAATGAAVEDAMALFGREIDWVGRQLEIIRSRERAALEVAELFGSLERQFGLHLEESQRTVEPDAVGPAPTGVDSTLLRIRTLVEHLDAGILVEDTNRIIHICNQKLSLVLGLDFGERTWIGRSTVEFEAELLSLLFDPETFESSTSAARGCEQAGPPEMILLSSLQVVERRCCPLWGEGALIGHLWTYRDVTAREQDKQLLERQANELRQLSLVDELTGLCNRRGYLTIANQHIKLLDRDNQTGLVVFIDLNGMKAINDEFGHDQGDRALIETAKVIRYCFRSSDVMARLGGDEFIAFAIGAGAESIEELTRRLDMRLAEVNATGELPFKLAFSVGMAEYDPAAGEMLEEVIARADGLMYASKRRAKAGRR